MTVLADLRYALRLLARSPIFTLTAVLSLALGVAATAGVFSMSDALLLRPRPGVANPATLVDVGRTNRGDDRLDNFGYPLFEALRDRATLLEGLAAMRREPDVMALGDATASERLYATLVSGNFFAVTGTRPAAGRFFAPDEDRTPGTHPVVVLSHQLWTRRFAQDPAIVGRTIRLNNLPYTVIGVAEDGFTGTTLIGTDAWIPMAMDAHVRASEQSLLTLNDVVWMTAIGRLRPGVTVAQAREELGAIMQTFMRERNDPRIERWRIAVAPSTRIPAGLSGPVIGFVSTLAALTVLVLLIACSNVAAMLLARALERRREVATRLAVGASRRRIMAQLLLEGATLAVIAGAVSLPLTMALVGLLSAMLPTLPIPLAIELRVDPRVMGFAFVLSALTAILFSLLPALQATRFELAPALHGRSTTADRRRAWLRHGLVTAQVAMALLLLVAAGLFLRSLQEAAAVDVGYTIAGVDTIQIDTRVGGYRTDAEGIRVINELREQFMRLPQVTAVGASRMMPLVSGRLGLGTLRAPGYAGPDGGETVEADWDVVSTGYFEALQLRVTRGRVFDHRDGEGSTPVVIVNEALAGRVWPGQDPIGRTLVQEQRDAAPRTLEVIGVARTARHGSLTEGDRNFVYVPLAQQYLSDVTFYVRRSSEDTRIADLRQAVVAFDPNLPVIQTQTLEAATGLALLPQRLAAWIAGGVGSMGLLLAALGLYGLTAFAVAQRRREIAVRMALGATKTSVLRLVLWQAGRVAATGMLIGLALAIAASRLLGSLLINVDTVDPFAFTIAAGALTIVLLMATWAPARRAADTDPMRTLRAE